MVSSHEGSVKISGLGKHSGYVKGKIHGFNILCDFFTCDGFLLLIIIDTKWFSYTSGWIEIPDSSFATQYHNVNHTKLQFKKAI